jgi:hypothetical protein
LFQERLEQRTVLSAVSPVATVLQADYTGDGVIDVDDLDTINRWIGPGGQSTGTPSTAGSVPAVNPRCITAQWI